MTLRKKLILYFFVIIAVGDLSLSMVAIQIIRKSKSIETYDSSFRDTLEVAKKVGLSWKASGEKLLPPKDSELELFKRATPLEMFVVDSKDLSVFNLFTNQRLQLKDLLHPTSIERLAKDGGKATVAELKSTSDDGIIASWTPIPETGFFVLGISQKLLSTRAYLPLLIKISLAGLIMLALATGGSLLISDGLSASIEGITRKMQLIGQGQLDIPLDDTGTDEAGVISANLKKMVSQIKQLIQKTASQARLEKEVETARLVQKFLFAPPFKTGNGFDISGYIKSASECGGDWWHYYESPGHIVFMIGDATGHGLPAALLTCAVRSAVVELEKAQERSPKVILEKLNAAVHFSFRGELMMTFAVMSVDLVHHDVLYANASHLAPIVLSRDAKGEVSLEYLIENNGKRLGEQASSLYVDSKYKLNNGDRIILLTDGITEVKNKASKMMSERRLEKIFTSVAHNGTAHAFTESVISTLEKYQAGAELSDDMSMIVLKTT